MLSLLSAPMDGGSTTSDKEREECLNVQRTNDESSVSKRSAAKLGYFEDEFLRYFVKKPSRRCPIINWGYNARVFAVRTVLRAFLQTTTTQPIQILSLGCGFDTSYFVLSTEDLFGRCCYFELDYPTLVARKINLIKEQSQLKGRLQGAIQGLDRGMLLSHRYKLFGLDLRDHHKLEGLIVNHGFDLCRPTLVLAECFLQYLLPEDSDALIQWVQSKIPHAMFVAFEQMEGRDAFGAVMRNNLSQRSSPLYGIEEYNSVQDQQRRYERLGYEVSRVVNLHHLTDNITPRNEQDRVRAMEVFDEWEEWRVTCSHYCMVTAVNKSEDVATFGLQPFIAKDSNMQVRRLGRLRTLQ